MTKWLKKRLEKLERSQAVKGSHVLVIVPGEATDEEVEALVERRCSEARGEVLSVVVLPDNGRGPLPKPPVGSPAKA